MVKLRDLEYLVAVDTHKHFGRAAEACFVSQPTLSGQIMKLEEQLDLQLIERHKRSVMLTPSGELLVREARKVLAAAEHFESTATSLLDPYAGDVHIGLIPTLAPYLLPHIMANLRQALPNVQFYLHENRTKDLLNGLNDGNLDVLVLPYLEDMQAFERYELFFEPLVLAIPEDHEFANRDCVKLEDLRGQKVLTLEDGHCLRDQAMGYCFAAGAKEDQQFRATSLETLRYMVASGMGITLMPKLATMNRNADEGLQYIHFQSPPPEREICLLMRPNYTRMALVRKLVAVIRDAMQPKTSF